MSNYFYVPSLSYEIQERDSFSHDSEDQQEQSKFKTVNGGVYSTEKKAIDSLIRKLVFDYRLFDFDEYYWREINTWMYSITKLEETCIKYQSKIFDIETLNVYSVKYGDKYFRGLWEFKIEKFDLDIENNFKESK